MQASPRLQHLGDKSQHKTKSKAKRIRYYCDETSNTSILHVEPLAPLTSIRIKIFRKCARLLLNWRRRVLRRRRILSHNEQSRRYHKHSRTSAIYWRNGRDTHEKSTHCLSHCDWRKGLNQRVSSYWLCDCEEGGTDWSKKVIEIISGIDKGGNRSSGQF